MTVIDFIVQKFFTYWYISIPTLLLTFFCLVSRRRLIYNGRQETINPSIRKFVFTDSVTGSTFYSKSPIIGLNKMAAHRKKFGKPAWSWSITIIVGNRNRTAAFTLFLLVPRWELCFPAVFYPAPLLTQ